MAALTSYRKLSLQFFYFPFHVVGSMENPITSGRYISALVDG